MASSAIQRLNAFVQSKLPLQVFHGTSLAKARTVCVLDSSFNPPNLAHQTIARRALDHFSQTDDTTALLLLFATANADKPSPEDVLSYAHRIDMMDLFAKDIGWRNTDLGITVHPKFVDKYTVIKAKYPHVGRIVFLTGFDTLVRIIDPVYYGGPESMAVSLGDFMKGAWIFALTRKPDAVSKTPETLKDIDQQRTLIDNIRSGKVPGIPPFWADHVVLSISDPETDGVSSSAARLALKQGQDASRLVSNRIRDYALNSGLYSEH